MADKQNDPPRKRCACGNLIVRAPQFGKPHPTKCVVCARAEKRKG